MAGPGGSRVFDAARCPGWAATVAAGAGGAGPDGTGEPGGVRGPLAARPRGNTAAATSAAASTAAGSPEDAHPGKRGHADVTSRWPGQHRCDIGVVAAAGVGGGVAGLECGAEPGRAHRARGPCRPRSCRACRRPRWPARSGTRRRGLRAGCPPGRGPPAPAARHASACISGRDDAAKGAGRRRARR